MNDEQETILLLYAEKKHQVPSLVKKAPIFSLQFELHQKAHRFEGSQGYLFGRMHV